ncbi:disease resistance protein Roq1-like [Lotus japonicus]|uniref:disease resistance protein Roq1-like n=1 Tax=Lotus japonicus TaxID=34305 RepID=UPI00258AE3A0|nr:disease resistance protein Roq1-like [Lotus japonicus]
MMSSFTCDWTYDVFLNFRGEDTRNNFTGSLYNSLDQKGIHTFLDDEELRKGEEIRPALVKAIIESRTAIMVFSENYAESTFCLDELVTILEHLKAQGRLVWPIFYDVDPSKVRHQTGSYAQALAKHEERFKYDKGKVQKWRKALYEAANLSGWHFKQGSQSEYKFIISIVDMVSKNLNHSPLHVADNPVGLESPVLQVESLLQLVSYECDNMVGICGIGGIGKTTIARAVYNKIADQFDGLCFLADIREKAINNHGLKQLQETLLSDILGEDVKIRDINHGIPLIKRKLGRKKILLILDDVDKLKQLKAVAGGYDWFGKGSRIIITSRDKHLLATHGVAQFYEVKELNQKQALELFSWNAFKSNKVDPSYEHILDRFLSYARGLPLALEVLGSNLYSKGVDEWNSALDKYKQVPNREIHEMLKISYDGLEEDEKKVFLDIACYFNKYKISYVKEILHVRGFHPNYSIGVLIDRSLMKIDELGCVRMHDLIKDMGREIVKQESSEPGERSRLWFDEDIIHVLQENTGTNKIEVIILYSHEEKRVHWNGKAFKKMRNLRVLIVGDAHFSIAPKHLPNSLRVLDWSGYPSPSLPFDFHPKELLILSLPNSCLILDKPIKMFDSLSFMDFEECKFLRQVPDLSGVPKLRALCVDNCINLIEIHDSVGFLDQLILLSAQGCIQLHTFGRAIRLPSLETLDLRWCTCLQRFPEVEGIMENIRDVYLDHTAIQELPFSIQNLIGLERLYLRSCQNLKQLPSIIRSLPKLEVITNHGQRGWKSFEPIRGQEEVKSKVFPLPRLWRGNYITNVYYICVSSENVIQGYFAQVKICRPMALPQPHRRPSGSFWFRKRFPAVTLIFEGKPDFLMHIEGAVIDFRIWVFLYGFDQFSFSSTCIIPAAKVTITEPLHLLVDVRNLQYKFEQGVREKVFSEHEWYHVMLSHELKCHMYDHKRVPLGQNTTITVTIPLKSIDPDTYTDDIIFGNPGLGIGARPLLTWPDQQIGAGPFISPIYNSSQAAVSPKKNLVKPKWMLSLAVETGTEFSSSSRKDEEINAWESEGE